MAETVSPSAGETLPEDTVLSDDSEQANVPSVEGEGSDEPGAIAEQQVIADVPVMPPDLVSVFWGIRPSLIRLASTILHDWAASEDIVSDALEAAARHYGTYDPSMTEQYLRQTVVNKALSVIRHLNVEKKFAHLFVTPEEPSASAEALVFASLEHAMLLAAVGALPERQAEVIRLRYYADLGVEDTAKSMGISRGAVKSHTSRAVTKLGHALGGIIEVAD